MFYLSLILLTYIQIRLHTGTTNNGRGSKFAVDRIIGLVQLSGLIPVLIREESHLRRFFPGDVGHRNTDQPQRSPSIPEFIK